jgi:hypothetical protein
MKFVKILAAASLALGLCGAASATEYRFTATSTASGVLGYLDLDSSVLDGTAGQFVDNPFLTDLHFVNPNSMFVVDTVGPSGQGTFFDSTGALPTVVGGSGVSGGTTTSNGVWIAGTSYVIVAGDAFADVHWSTAAVSAVPEPSELGLMLAGVGLLVAGARRRRS